MIGKNLQAPDYAEKATCYRTWALKEGELYPFYKTDEPWYSGKNTAICKAKTKCECAPEKKCKCGLYGLHTLLPTRIINQGVIGVTEHWGKTELHKDGLRSQYAQIKVLTSKPDFFQKFHQYTIYSNKIYHNLISKILNFLLVVWLLFGFNILFGTVLILFVEQRVALLNTNAIIMLTMFIMLGFIIFFPIITNKKFRKTIFKSPKQSQQELQEYCKQHNITYVDNIKDLKQYHTNRIRLNKNHKIFKLFSK